MIRKVYLGQMSAGAGVATGSDATLSGGEVSELADAQIIDIWCDITTAVGVTGSATFQLKTGNNTVLSDAVQSSGLQSKGTLNARNVQLAAADVANPFKATIGGTSTSFDSGVADWYALIHTPRN